MTSETRTSNMRGVHTSSQQEPAHGTWWPPSALIVSDFQESSLVSKKLKFVVGFLVWYMSMMEGSCFQEKQLDQNRTSSQDTDCVPMMLGFYVG